MLPSRLIVGKQGHVIPGNSVNIRTGPAVANPQIGKMLSNDVFTVLDGPRCSVSFTWWQINFNGTVGWVIEAQGATYVLEMLPDQAPIGTASLTVSPVVNTAVSPAVFSPTVTLTPSLVPTSPIGITCPGALPSRLSVADIARVIIQSGANSVRQNPAKLGTLLGYLNYGVAVTVIDGPTCADGYAWYKIRYPDPVSTYNVLEGWTVESAEGVYSIEPYEPSGLQACSQSPVNSTPLPSATSGTSADLAYIPKYNFANGRSVGGPIDVMNIDGTQNRELVAADGDAPVWSPDGSRIAYIHTGILAVMNSDGSDSHDLTPKTLQIDSIAWFPDGGKLIFASTIDGNSELYLISLDGHSACRLTHTLADEESPVVSPDGSRIAVGLLQNNNQTIQTMSIAGTDPKRLTSETEGYAQAPSWSPDSTQIAFLLNNNQYLRALYTIHADGSAMTYLSVSNLEASTPTWSPDGRYLLVTNASGVGHPPLYEQLLIISADGESVHSLSYNPIRTGFKANWSRTAAKTFSLATPPPPTVSPFIQKGHLAFVGKDSDSHQNIYTLNADGTNLKQVTQGDNNVDPAWSPDGKQIAFMSTRTGNEEIYSMDADGSNVHRLTYNDALDTTPAWLPNGKQIAFVSNRAGAPNIWIMNTDGTHPTKLSETAVNSPRWSPDGRSIAFLARDKNQDSVLNIMDSTGLNPKPFHLPGIINNPGAPAWSPDSAHVAFVNSVTDSRYAGILIVAVGQPEVKHLGWTSYITDSATWSPDGAYIAYLQENEIYASPIAQPDSVVYLASGPVGIRLSQLVWGN
jgi:Tol biopolymer transport system component